MSPGHPLRHRVKGVQCLAWSQHLLLLVFHPVCWKASFHRCVHQAHSASRELRTTTTSRKNLVSTARQPAALGTQVCSLRRDILAWTMALSPAPVLLDRPYQRDSGSLLEVKCFHIFNTLAVTIFSNFAFFHANFFFPKYHIFQNRKKC